MPQWEALSTTDPEGGAMTYTITAGGTDFNISGSALRATNSFDYEVTNSYSVTVRVTDGGSLTYDETFTINVSDVNEAPSDISLSNASVAENSGPDATVGTLSGTDSEADAITYTITAGGSDFNLVGTTLRATNAFDYEITNSYSVRVRATSTGGLTYDEAFTISVTDVNEVPTGLALSNASVAENTGPNATVGNLSTTDPEDGAMTYTITAGGADFNINGSTLRATNSFDYEGTNSYSVTVRATSTGGSLTYDETFTINVSDVNEAPTDIVLSNASVAENAGSDATVGTFSGTDPEADAITYTITVGGSDFNLDGTTLRATNSFDYEGTNSYSVTVRATSTGGLTYDEAFTINVSDVNEAPTDISLSNASVSENTGSNATVGTLSGTDPEADAITYTITVGGSDFNLDGTTLRATNSFDYEGTNSYSVTVRVTDGGSLPYEETFTINVTDVNEAPTDISLSNASVAENAGSNATVGTLSGTDPEADGITYTITVGGSGFSLDGTTLRASNSFDYEGTNSYSVTVRATSTGGSLTYDETFTINVSDVNEAPTDISLSNASVAENAGSNAIVGSLSGTDSEADAITYSIISGGTNFNLDGRTLRATNSFDYEVTNSYLVTVRASDVAGLTYDEIFTVNVTNVNETPVADIVTYEIAENGTWSGSHTYAQATDVDAGTTFIYTLADSSVFGINQSLGIVTLKGNLNFATTTGYTLTVIVSDGALSDDAIITVNVTNVNDAPIMTIANLTIDENSLAGTKVDGTISVFDEDNDVITWLLPEDSATDNILFNIDSHTGELTLKQDSTIDYEITDKLNILIIAKDEFLSTSQPVEITVGDISEAPDVTTSILTNSDTIKKGPRISGLPAGSIIEEGQLFISSNSEVTILSIDGQVLVKQLGSTWIRTSEWEQKNIYIIHSNNQVTPLYLGGIK